MPKPLRQPDKSPKSHSFSAARLFVCERIDGGLGPPRLTQVALGDRRYWLPSMVHKPKNLPIVAKRIQIAGIGGDLNNGPCHAIFLSAALPAPSTIWGLQKIFRLPIRVCGRAWGRDKEAKKTTYFQQYDGSQRPRIFRLLCPIAVLLALLALNSPVQAQLSKTIRIVVPFTPGGGSDLLGRILADYLRRVEGISTVVENRVGAGSVIGTEAVSRAAPDGTTLLINTPNIVIAPHLRTLSYDPLTSFEPICKLGSSPALVVVNNRSPFRSIADLVGAARARPGALTLASVGPATTLHLAAEKLKRSSRAEMIYVPFPGSGTAVSALLGEHVTAVLAELPAVSAQIASGELRALATGQPTRNGPLPDLPTIAEAGLPGFEIDLWWGVFAPAHTPKDVIFHLVSAFRHALETPDLRSKLADIGFYPDGVCGEHFVSYLHQQYSEYGAIIRQANIKGE